MLTLTVECEIRTPEAALLFDRICKDLFLTLHRSRRHSL